MRSLARSALALAALAGLSGCASVGASAYRQNVIIRSDPPGATILQNGVPISRAPAIVSVPRAHFPVLQLQSKDGTVDVPIQSRYRFGRSFFGNFIFLTLAPVGWAIDFMTGSAWLLEDPAPTRLSLTPSDEREAKADRARRAENAVAVIAPPLSDSLELSDRGAIELEASLAGKNRGEQLRPYRETQRFFVQNGFDFDGAPTDARALYLSLDARYVYESSIERSDSGFRLVGARFDMTTLEPDAPFTIPLKSSDPMSDIYSSSKWWARLLPNSIGLIFAAEDLIVSAGGQSYRLSQVGADQWWQNGLQYLSAIDITNVPVRRPGRSFRWTFDFIPAIRLSHTRARTTGLPLTSNDDTETYERLRAGAGYGVEGGMQFGRHYVYLNLIPLFTWSQIKWNNTGSERSVTNMAIQTPAELGYAVFIDSNWHVKLFTRSQAEDLSGWSEAIGQRLPISQRNGFGVTYATAGLSIGYRFAAKYTRDLGMSGTR